MLRYIGRNANNHTAFLCIKTSTEDRDETNQIHQSFVLPVELEVTQNSAIFSQLEQIDFGKISIKSLNSNMDYFVPSSISHSDTSVLNNQLMISPFLLNDLSSSENYYSERVVDLCLTNSGPNSLYIKVHIVCIEYFS